MRALYLATVANRVMPSPTPRSCRRSSTLRSESGKRTYSITAKRMISGLVLKYLNGECFVIRRSYETARSVSSSFCLTVPTFVINGSPEIMCLSIYLYEDLVQVPLPVRIRSHPTDPVSSYLSSQHRTKSIPPKPNCFVADLNASFVQKIFHVTE